MKVLLVAALALAAQETGFEDVTAKSRVTFRNQSSPTPRKYLIESMVGGVAMLDYNSDGYLDLFFVNGAKLNDPMERGARPDKSEPAYWNRLYRNNQDGTFTDVTESAGVRGEGFGMGVAVGDFDNDGHPDLYVTGWERNMLYRNRGDGTFVDVTEKAGVGGSGWSAAAAFVDFDLDGRLDLVVSRYVEWGFHLDFFCGDRKPGYRSYCHPDQFKPISHLLFRNNGDGTFSDVSKSSGLGSSPGKGLGIAINDYDGDGWPDILIANDSAPQQLFHNQKGRFTEVALEMGLGFDEDGRTFAGMGVDFADYDNDGRPDIFINALANQRYALFHNTGSSFDYVSGPSGVTEATLLHSGWGAKFFDYDNDGWRDLFVAQGHVMDNIELTQPNIRYREPLLLLRNTRGKFSDVSKSSGEIFKTPLAARGAAFGDLDNDGFIDVAINCSNGPAVILKNKGSANHWLALDLQGTKSNRDAIGARIRVSTASGPDQTLFVNAAGSYLSSNDRKAYFGLGSNTEAKSVEIRWPSGRVQRLEKLATGKIHKIVEPTE